MLVRTDMDSVAGRSRKKGQFDSMAESLPVWRRKIFCRHEERFVVAAQRRMSEAIARGAVFFALALLAQSLRLFVPIPPLAGMFVIGSLVNALLLLAAIYAGWRAAALLGILLPAAAFMQGQLPAPIFIPGVAAGNLVFIACGHFFWRQRALYFAPFLKAGILYAGLWMALRFTVLPSSAAKAAAVLMSWPQVITALCGILLAQRLAKRI